MFDTTAQTIADRDGVPVPVVDDLVLSHVYPQEFDLSEARAVALAVKRDLDRGYDLEEATADDEWLAHILDSVAVQLRTDHPLDVVIDVLGRHK